MALGLPWGALVLAPLPPWLALVLRIFEVELALLSMTTGGRHATVLDGPCHPGHFRWSRSDAKKKKSERQREIFHIPMRTWAWWALVGLVGSWGGDTSFPLSLLSRCPSIA